MGAATTDLYTASKDAATQAGTATRYTRAFVNAAGNTTKYLQKAEQAMPSMTRVTATVAPAFNRIAPVAEAVAPYAGWIAVGATAGAGAIETAEKIHHGDNRGATTAAVKSTCLVATTAAGTVMAPGVGTLVAGGVGMLACGPLADHVGPWLYDHRQALLNGFEAAGTAQMNAARSGAPVMAFVP